MTRRITKGTFKPLTALSDHAQGLHNPGLSEPDSYPSGTLSGRGFLRPKAT